MSEWTTPEDVPEVVRERLHDWLNTGNPAHATTLANYAVAEVIRAFWPVPARTLADELAHITEVWETWTTDMITGALTAATTRAKQMEHDRDDTRAEVEHAEDRAAEWQGIAQRDYAKVELLTAERDEARAEVERLDAERLDRNSEMRMLTSERNEALIEVERLTAERDRIASGRYITYAEVDGKPVQKDAEAPDPADVPPREVWVVRAREREAVAVRDGDPFLPWSAALLEGGIDDVEDENVTLITRLVPAPRVITNTGEIDRLPELTIVRDKFNEAMQKVGGRWVPARVGGSRGVAYVLDHATVLWEPGA